MKKGLVQLSLILVSITGIHSIKMLQKCTVCGKVYPSQGVETVTASNGSDLTVLRLVNGSFSLPVKPGNWTITVISKQPYKNITRNLVIKEGEGKQDLGTLSLYN